MKMIGVHFQFYHIKKNFYCIVYFGYGLVYDGNFCIGSITNRKKKLRIKMIYIFVNISFILLSYNGSLIS